MNPFFEELGRRLAAGARARNVEIAPPEIDRNIPVAVHCKGGYRSMIACSLLQRAGFQNVINIVGGFDAWQQANLPVVIEKPVIA